MPSPSIPTSLYTVGWICVTLQESEAAWAVLDEEHPDPIAPSDDCQYMGGKMGGHHVIIGRATRPGMASINNTATNMTRSFSNVRFILMVGIAGGAPEPEDDGPQGIFLGDVVVNRAKGDHAGIVEYGNGIRNDGELEPRSHLNKTPEHLIRAINNLESKHRRRQGHMKRYLNEAMDRLGQLGISGIHFPGRDKDLLFNSDYKHQPRNKKIQTCENCNQGQVVQRVRQDNDPRVHYGVIASGESLIRDAAFRDNWQKSHDVLCFEMEGASLMNAFGCLVIRGISDYSDSHKNDLWQPYAALTAAAYAKDLLALIPLIPPESPVVPDSVVQQTRRVDLNNRLLGARSLAEGLTLVLMCQIFLQTVVENGVNEIRRDILNWLGTLDFAEKQNFLLEGSVNSHFCQWLVNNHIFEYWMKGCSWQLRCYGGAGVGKTHLCALIIDHLQHILPNRFPSETRSRPVIYIYLSDDKDDRAKQTKHTILGSLVKQLLQIQNASSLPDKLVKAHSRELAYEPALKNVFEDLLNYFERTYLIVDGLYQCSIDVLHLVKDYPLSLIRRGFRLSLLTTSSGYRESFRVIQCDNESCVGSKPVVYFNCACTEEGYDLCLDCKLDPKISCPNNHIGREKYDTVRVQMNGHDQDIRSFCLQRLRQLTDTSHRESDDRIEAPLLPSSPLGRHLVGKPEMMELIANEIAHNAQGNFLIANGWLEHLEDISCDSHREFDEEIRLSLVSVPCATFQIYLTERFKKIEYHKPEKEIILARRAVSFVMAAYVPLNILALQQALSLDTANEIRKVRLVQRVDIIRAANGLLTIDKASPAESFVRLFHPSFREVSVDNDSVASFKNHHSRMAKLCLKYLDHKEFPHHAKDPESYPFLLYAIEYWGDHVREAREERDDEVHSRAREFLRNSSKVRQMVEKAAIIAQNAVELAQMDEETAQQYLKVNLTLPRSWFNDSVSAFHLCAWYNLPNLIEDLRKDCGRSDILNSEGRPPLRYACFNGSLEAAKALLESDSVPTLQRPSIPLCQAAIRDVINGLSQSTRVDKEDRALIERRVDIIKSILRHSDLALDSSIDYQGSTALMCVVKEGLHNFAKILLQRECVDVNLLNNDGRSALWYAMGSTDDGSPPLLDHEQIESMTKLLLSHGAILGGVGEQPRENVQTKATYSAV
ncbi:hypothetical protein N7528_007355 [Penicillium herquei]|nr:hypothetical protein N7528_007355 [Penicillium herquei]